MLWIDISCFRISLTNHCWIADKRLVISRFDGGYRSIGNIIMRRTTGRPISVGVANEANRFSFILFLRGRCKVEFLKFWVVVLVDINIWIYLIEIG